MDRSTPQEQLCRELYQNSEAVLIDDDAGVIVFDEKFVFLSSHRGSIKQKLSCQHSCKNNLSSCELGPKNTTLNPWYHSAYGSLLFGPNGL